MPWTNRRRRASSQACCTAWEKEGIRGRYHEGVIESDASCTGGLPVSGGRRHAALGSGSVVMGGGLGGERGEWTSLGETRGWLCCVPGTDRAEAMGASQQREGELSWKLRKA